jgi:acyl carrier protein
MFWRGARQVSLKDGGRYVAFYRRLFGRARRTEAAPGLRSLRERVEPRLRALVAEGLGVEPHQLDEHTSLAEDLAADSLDLLDLIVRIEDELGVVVPERDIAAIRTYGELAAAVVALVACRGRAQAEAERAAAGALEVRIGAGQVPRFLRVVGSEPYDREVVREDLEAAGPSEPVAVNGLGDVPAEEIERMLMRARFAGTDVHTPDRSAVPPGVAATREPADARHWPAARLTAEALGVVAALRAECDASLARLGAASSVPRPDLAATRAVTDDRVSALRALVDTYLELLQDARPVLQAAAREVGRLVLVRRGVDERTLGAPAARDAFESIGDALLCYVHALQSQVAWTRTRLPPRAMTSSAPNRGAAPGELHA